MDFKVALEECECAICADSKAKYCRCSKECEVRDMCEHQNEGYICLNKPVRDNLREARGN